MPLALSAPVRKKAAIRVKAGPHLPVRPAVTTSGGRTGLLALAVLANLSMSAHLWFYDLIVFNHSGGKDSVVGLHELYTLAKRLGVTDRIVVVHNDLGWVEWPGTAELDAVHGDYYRKQFGTTLVERFGDRPSARGVAERQAARYGLPFVVRSRTAGDLLQQIEQYGKFPDAANRHCTSEQKRGPKFRLFTELVAGLAHLGRKVRILDVNGERAEESTARASKPAFEYNKMASNKTKRDVWTWRIVHDWTLDQVWDCHIEHDLEWHWAYDAGMSRLSCSICVLGAVEDVTLACLLRPDLAREILALEGRINHQFKAGRSIGWYIERAQGRTLESFAGRSRTRREPTGGCGGAPVRPEQAELFDWAVA